VARTGKASLLIVFVTVFIDLLGFGIVMPLLPRYAQDFQASEAQLGMLMASFSAMQFLFAPLWGRLSDRVGRRPILMLGLAGSTLSYALFGYVNQLGVDSTLLGLGALTWLFISRIGAGVAGATISTAQAYIADATDQANRGKGMALIGAAFGIGFTFGPLLGAAFVSAESSAPSPMPGYAAATLSGIALLFAIFKLPESLAPDSVPHDYHWLDARALHRALLRPAVGMILLTMFITTFAFAQFESTLSVLTRELGMENERNNFFVFAYVGLVLTISQGVLVRRLIPKLGESRMAIVGTSLMTIGMLGIGIAAKQTSLTLLYCVLPIGVVGFSAVTPSMQSLLSRCSADEEQGGILGLGQSMSALARILGPLAGMLLFGHNASYPYWSAASLMGLGLLLVASLRKPEPDSTSESAAGEI